MQSDHISPLAGKPRTVMTIMKSGTPVFRVKARALTPRRARAADQVHSVLTVLWAIRCVVAFSNLPSRGLIEILVMVAMFGGGSLVLRGTVRAAMASTTEIVLSADTIRFRRWLFWRNYNRRLEHHFALSLHEGAAEEARAMDIKSREAAAKGRVLKQKPYWGESFHVWLSYGGHPVILLDVYGPKEATAIVARLTYCDRALNEAIGMAGGITDRPEDDWTDAPGGISHAT